MQVVDHEPHDWFLFKDGDALLLDVNCNHGAVGYSVLIQLTADEAAEYARRGHAYLSALSRAVNGAGPGRGYQLRDVSAHYSAQSLAAVKAWRSSSRE